MKINKIESKIAKPSLSGSLVPMVVEKESGGYERSYDIYSRLLKDFVVFVNEVVDMPSANTFIAQLLFLESQDANRDISVYINCAGGNVHAGTAMYDTMKHIKNDIVTINVGLAASAASLLLSGGTKGKRYMLPNAYTMIHQPVIMGGLEGQVTDIEIESRQGVRVKHQYAQMIANDTGKTLEQALSDMERNYWMNAKEALDYGLIDKIMEPKNKTGK